MARSIRVLALYRSSQLFSLISCVFPNFPAQIRVPIRKSPKRKGIRVAGFQGPNPLLGSLKIVRKIGDGSQIQAIDWGSNSNQVFSSNYVESYPLVAYGPYTVVSSQLKLGPSLVRGLTHIFQLNSPITQRSPNWVPPSSSK